jgi:uncharacterized membrane protein
MELLREAALVFATMTMGLIAGLFYSYACSVMLALRRADDRVFVDVMQRINAAIQNGWFAISFFGAVLFTALAALLQIGADQPSRVILIIAALLLYLISFVITIRGNIPLNLQLDAAGPAPGISNPATIRRRFEGPWIRLHLARTLFSIGGFACLCVASVSSN